MDLSRVNQDQVSGCGTLWTYLGSTKIWLCHSMDLSRVNQDLVVSLYGPFKGQPGSSCGTLDLSRVNQDLVVSLSGPF